MILIAGPPCGGKSTYARKHAKAGQAILDFDDIVEEISGDRYNRSPDVVAAARKEWGLRLPSSDWVIWSAPRQRDRGNFRNQFDATVLVVWATEGECLLRAAARPPSWQPAIRRWFMQWEPSRSGREQLINTTPNPEERHGEEKEEGRENARRAGTRAT